VNKEDIPTQEALAYLLQKCEQAAITEGLTTKEWQLAWNIGITKTRRILSYAIQNGLMITRSVLRPNPLLGGDNTNYKVHCLTAKGRKKLKS
jgi:hypothetical protein